MAVGGVDIDSGCSGNNTWEESGSIVEQSLFRGSLKLNFIYVGIDPELLGFSGTHR
jgi:hypothetical protein